MTEHIAIIGAGNLGQSIASGLLSKGLAPQQLTLTRHKTDLLQAFSEKQVHVTHNNLEAVQQAQIIILAVKPYKLDAVLEEIASHLKEDHIIISVVSDYGLEDISKQLPQQPTLFRAMPNTATSVNESMTCISTNGASSAATKKVQDIFNSLGKSIVIEEQLMDAATVLGACGIAYVLRFIRGMIQGGVEIGFDITTATTIATQTVKGASALLLQNNNHPEAEIDKVTTPKGCTIAGLNEMEHQGFSSSLIKGIKTSFKNISE